MEQKAKIDEAAELEWEEKVKPTWVDGTTFFVGKDANGWRAALSPRGTVKTPPGSAGLQAETKESLHYLFMYRPTTAKEKEAMNSDPFGLIHWVCCGVSICRPVEVESRVAERANKHLSETAWDEIYEKFKRARPGESRPSFYASYRGRYRVLTQSFCVRPCDTQKVALHFYKVAEAPVYWKPMTVVFCKLDETEKTVDEVIAKDDSE